MKTIETSVLIVGSGPTGLSAALFLARHDIDTLIITRSPWTADTPRAHITNQRTMEIMRAVGLDGACREKASSRYNIQHTIWATSFAGDELGRIYAWGNDPARLSEYMLASPMELCDLPQTYFEPILLDAAAQRGARVRFENELVDFEQSSTDVTATVLDRTTGETYRVCAKYLIGADGGRSIVAEKLGLPMLGVAGIESAINVLFDADLSQYVAHRPASIVYVIGSPAASWSGLGIVRMVRPWREWLAIFPAIGGFSGRDPAPEMFNEPIRLMIGDDSIRFHVRSISQWQVNHVIAGHYSRGRVICAGDAVHRHPPMNGLGSNTCVQDSFNLCWKIALAIKGIAAPGLVDTYSVERQPVGKRVVDRAIESFKGNHRVMEALGVQSGQSSSERDAVIAGLSATTVEGAARRLAWREALEEKHGTFNALGMELNQIYADGAIVTDGQQPELFERNLDLHYHSTAFPGARLPHCWLERDRARISSLEMLSPERFTLLVGPLGRGWHIAASAVRERFCLNLDVVEISMNGAVSDVYGHWCEISGTDEAGCVLVRPDMHVAWRSRRGVANHVRELNRVVGSILRVA